MWNVYPFQKTTHNNSSNQAAMTGALVLPRAQFFDCLNKSELKIMEKEEKQKRETPIVDGDARPDVPVDGNEIKDQEKRKKNPDDKKFETERVSDVNSLEDYKDAK